jgi:hypothetical protein
VGVQHDVSLRTVQVMYRNEGLSGSELPWEDASLTPVGRKQLGIFKSSVLTLLSHEPTKRLSMEQFCDTCNRVLASSTSVQV